MVSIKLFSQFSALNLLYSAQNSSINQDQRSFSGRVYCVVHLERLSLVEKEEILLGLDV